MLEYAYGLPRLMQKRKGKPWCRDIVKADKNGEDGDTLIDLISTKILRMNYQDRQSTSNCVEQTYRLGFHWVQTFKTSRVTPMRKSMRQHDITRRTGFKSIVVQSFESSPPDGDVSPGFYYVGETSESTEIALSKRDL